MTKTYPTSGSYGPKCPACQHGLSTVKDSRPSDVWDGTRRRRQCLLCHHRFTTAEVVVEEVRALPTQSVMNMRAVLDKAIDNAAATLEDLKHTKRLLGGKAGEHLERGYKPPARVGE